MSIFRIASMLSSLFKTVNQRRLQGNILNIIIVFVVDLTEILVYKFTSYC